MKKPFFLNSALGPITLRSIAYVWFLYYMACAPMKFNYDPQSDPCQANPESCVPVVPKPKHIDTTINVPGGMVDILFVDDNSGSMSSVQNHIAERFSSFIGKLYEKNVDFRIAITTTDISSPTNGPRESNGNGAFQDGKLISFSNGASYLSRNDGDLNYQTSLFAQAIKRNETLVCESYLNSTTSTTDYDSKCPSGDERGIYAANLVVRNNPYSFIRPSSHLAIVIISNEDVRSGLYSQARTWQLDVNDSPASLVSSIQSTLGFSKPYSFHSIIIKPGSLNVDVNAANDRVNQLVAGLLTNNSLSQLFSGGDSACLNSQNSSTANTRSSYGYLYAILTKMSNGVQGDICAYDYGAQLTDIGNNITQRVGDVQLACASPENLSVSLVPSNSTPSYQVDGNLLKFTSTLSGVSKIHLVYDCP